MHDNMAFKRKSTALGLERRVRPRREDQWEDDPESQGSSSEDDDEVEEEGVRGQHNDEDEDEEGSDSEEGSEDESEVCDLYPCFSVYHC